eukprot:7725355-Pyramimonas_sp.AAC.1
MCIRDRHISPREKLHAIARVETGIMEYAKLIRATVPPLPMISDNAYARDGILLLTLTSATTLIATIIIS